MRNHSGPTAYGVYHNMNVVIRAGGVGTRLWPLSRQARPKQFHSLVDEATLFRSACDRASSLVDSDAQIFVSCAADLDTLVLEQGSEISPFNIIREPCSRNTGPAMCLEAAVLETRLGLDEVIFSIPSDDFIGNTDAFTLAMAHASSFVTHTQQWLVTPCVPAARVDTGFSYVEPGQLIHQGPGGGFYEIKSWTEKPSNADCVSMVNANVHSWHVGMYMYQLGNMIALWEEFHPDVLKVCRALARDLPGAREAYAKLQSETVEAMITKKSDMVAMFVASDVEWSDVGKWHVIKRLLKGDLTSNVMRGQVFAHDMSDSLVYGQKDKATAVIGLDNVVVVDTKDGLLVAAADRSHEIKEVLSRMKPEYQ